MKRMISLAMALILCLALFAGCGQSGSEGSPNPSISPEQASDTPSTRTKVNFAVLSGPTGIGAAKLLEDAEAGRTTNDYDVTIAAAPDELTGKIINGDLDIAAMSTNLALTLFNKTDGEVQMLAINTLGVLYILENGDTIQSMADLEGKTIYAFGQGANPEYALNYLLEQNGLKAGEDVTVEFKSNEEIITAMASGDAEVAMLPVPAATTVLMKNENVRTALDLTQEWNEATDGNSQLTMGCIVVRREFAEENKAAVDAFLEEYSASVTYVKENVEDASKLVEQFNLTGDAQIAAAAIPQCNLTCITGEEMQSTIGGYYEVLYAAEPSSIGGNLPDDSFYYIP